VFATTSSNLILLFIDGSTPFYATKWFLSLMISILIFPLTLLKEIEKLKFVSLIGIASILIFTIAIVYNFFKVVLNGGPPEGRLITRFILMIGFGVLAPTDFSFSRAFGCLPTVIMAYQWQFNFFPIYKGMSKPT
jgi:amino acid permease